ncbi:MAG: glycosyltransferase [Pseudomonadota bacterium]
MAEVPRLSIIVPHLNAAGALHRCLAALAEQCADRSDVEVIVVDNGSETKPISVCDLYDFVRLAEEPEPGPGPARSHGAHLAAARLLAFIDSDCIAAPGWIDGIIGYFGTHPETGVIGGDVRIHLADAARITSIEAYESVYGYRMQLYIERDHYAATCNMAVRRRVFDTVGDFAGIAIAEDVDWGRRATALDVQIDYVPEIQIATPARVNFQELTRKWDRHISHEFAELRGKADHMRWFVRALAIAVSPFAELGRIARSARISGVRSRGLALFCLVRIRLYRARRMLDLLRRGDGAGLSSVWRRRS